MPDSPDASRRFDEWEPPQSLLEAKAFALFAVRRALTQSLVGLPLLLLLRREGAAASLAEIARGAWDREFHWLWPRDLAAPELPAQPTLVEVFYGLVRHRAVTEALLLRSSEADLDRPHESRATLEAPATLSSVLERVGTAEFAEVELIGRRRARLQPEWAGIAELLDRAGRAVASSRTGT